MTVATLFQRPETADEFSTWSFTHQAMHRDIARVIFEVSGIRLDEFVLDPFDPKDEASWATTHQIMHEQMNRVLGISGFPLNAVDWSNSDQLETWLRVHGNEHFQAGQILNIG